MKKAHPSQGGYSLAEALVVIAIIGMITVASVPAFMNLKHANEMKVSLTTFVSDLRWSRQQAVANQRRMKVSYTNGTQSDVSWSVFEETTAGTWSTTPLRSGTLQNGTYFFTTTYTDLDSDSKMDLIYLPSGNIDTSCPVGNNTIVIKSFFQNSNLKHPTYTVTVTPVGVVKTS